MSSADGGARPAGHDGTDGTGADGSGSDDGVLRLLFICTANQCRSPLAEVLAVDQLARRHIPAQVSSAGFLDGGVEAAYGSQKAAAKRGLDLSQHRSRRVTPDMVKNADVVVTMEPDHVLRLIEETPDARGRALTLRELARYAERDAVYNPIAGSGRLIGGDGDSGVRPDGIRLNRIKLDRIRTWVGSTTSRDLQSLLSAENIVVDPMGRSDRAFRKTAKEIDQLLTTIFDSWFGPTDG